MATTKPKTSVYPLIITRGQVYFPLNDTDDLDCGRTFTMNGILDADRGEDKLVAVVTQLVYRNDNPELDDLYKVGVLAKLTKVKIRPNYITVRLIPLDRITLLDMKLNDSGYYEATVTPKKSKTPKNFDAEQSYKSLLDLLLTMPDVNQTLISYVKDFKLEETPFLTLLYHVSNELIHNTIQRQTLLEEDNVQNVYNLLIKYLKDEVSETKVDQINRMIRSKSEQGSAENVAQSTDDDEDEELDTAEEILRKLDKNFYPDYIKKRVKKEVRRLSKNDVERAKSLDYIDWVLRLPYQQETADNLDLENIARVLDEDHYGLNEPKKRIVEFIAVKRMTKNNRAPIICFAGPPGTGKTSLAMSIARALGRKLVKSSLGGVDDEAKIRGFLRTYVGSQPGTIIQNMAKAGTINPVFVLDEIDKLGRSNQGDPASALLEALDPKQNKTFVDHYIEEPYDLSKVMFICTANDVRNIPRPLLDRMELITLKPYTEEEKLNIALRHLVPKEIREHGLDDYNVTFTEDAILEIINSYTFEAGVRGLDKQIASVLRKLSVRILNDDNPKFTIDKNEVKNYLGQELIRMNKKEECSQVGVVTGLCVISDIGGDILPIEVTTYKGKGKVSVTGNLEEMMEESGHIAATHVHSFAKDYGIDPDVFNDLDINIHFPDAAPKDGNSAGVAMTIGIISVLTHRKVNCDYAMTGEVSLMGKVLPIGGVQEKIIGAIRAGIKTVIIPKANERELKEIPKEVLDKIEVKVVERVSEVVDLVLLPKED
jgi:ATP-dependent Lon protease